MANQVWSPLQRRAIELRSTNALISAGAGSGKTSVLVERVLSLIIDPPRWDVNRLLVVTFTEAAAAEMRQRIGSAIQRRLAEAEREGDDELIRHLARQISLLEVAQISTLHSFCMAVVRRNVLTLGLVPQFRLMAEDDAAVLRADLFRVILEDLLESQGADVESMLEAFATVDPLHLSDLVFRLDEFSRSQPHPGKWLSEVAEQYETAGSTSFSDLLWHDWFYRWVERSLSEAFVTFADAHRMTVGVPELAAYEQALLAAKSCVEQAQHGAADRAATDSILQPLTALLAAKSPRASEHPLREAVKARRTTAMSTVKRIAAVLARTAAALHEDVTAMARPVASLVALVQTFQQRYATAKQKRGVLDFNDLEHFAYQALMDDTTGEAARLQHHFGEIFVDEYQDTSPLQDAIVQSLARPGGNVFMVGDVKQSIYRFRMAEPAIFLDKYRNMASGELGQVIALNANYRSRSAVVNAVNFLFGRLFAKSLGGIAYDEAARMVAGAVYPDAQDAAIFEGPVEVHLVERSAVSDDHSHSNPSDSDSESDMESTPVDADEMRAIEQEGIVIARRIRAYMGVQDLSVPTTRRHVWDKDLGAYRPLQYRDIAILLRSVKGRMNELLNVLRTHGIPAYGATSTGLFDALEVGWLMAALATIDLPRQELALVTVLRSPIGQLADTELAAIRLLGDGNFYDALTAAARWRAGSQAAFSPELALKCEQLVSRIRRWRQLARRATTVDVIRDIYAETGLLDYVLGMPGGKVRRANLQLLLDKAAQYDRLSNEGAFGFSRWLNRMMEHDLDAGEARTLAESEDVVRVMTIHQSKGLEFPVVFVADLGKQLYQSPQERSLPLHRHLGFGPLRTDPSSDQRWWTLATFAIAEANHIEFLAEEARILYVAMTRAREQLVLVGSARELNRQLARSWEFGLDEEGTLSTLSRLSPRTYLDWLLPCWFGHRDAESLRDAVDTDRRLSFDPTEESGFSFQIWPSVSSVIPSPVEPMESSAANATVVELQAVLTAHQEAAPTGPDSAAALKLAIPSKVSATDLRRLWMARMGQRPTFHAGNAERMLRTPRAVHEETPVGADLGNAFHGVMEALDFTRIANGEAIEDLLAELVHRGRVEQSMVDAINPRDVTAFLSSPCGLLLLRAKRIYREKPLFCRIQIPQDQDHDSAFVVVQGVMDTLAEVEEGWVVIDYKTDRVQAGTVAAKASEYHAQVATYMHAVKSIVGQRVSVRGFLYFVRPRVGVEMEALDVASIWQPS